jgi:hypothetical protein
MVGERPGMIYARNEYGHARGEKTRFRVAENRPGENNSLKT